MTFQIRFSEDARATYDRLAAEDPSKYRKVRKTLGLMETNLRSPGLQTHAYASITGPCGEKMFEAYVENVTPGAYRIFWHYGPGKGIITVTAITPHP